MASYIPPSKRKEQKVIAFDPQTLANETVFPGLGTSVAAKTAKGGFKEVIEERLRKEAEDAIRLSQPVNLWSLGIAEREALGYSTLKVKGNTREEMVTIVERLFAYPSPQEESF